MKRKELPEWTPPINGWEYRFTEVDTLVDGTVYRAMHKADGVYISYKSYAYPRWFINRIGTSFNIAVSGATLEDAIDEYERRVKQLKREVAKL